MTLLRRRSARLTMLLGLLAVSLGAAPRADAAPQFVQQTSSAQLSVGTSGLAVTPTANVVSGNRLIVVAEGWNSASGSAAGVTDSAGDLYTRLVSQRAPDQTEVSVWSAPVTAGGGARPTVTVRPTGTMSLGVAVLEYSGLSAAAGTAVVDRVKGGGGTTSAAATVASGATAALSTDGALVLGVYGDSGFDVALTADVAYTQRLKTAPSPISDLLVEDRLLGTGATPNATVRTGANTDWAMITLALRAASTVPDTAPAAPTAVAATAGDQSATVTWTAPADGGRPITSYVVTPYAGATALAPTTVIGSPPAERATVSGLANGTSYTFKVRAVNAIGSGPDSAASGAVTPVATPGGQWGPRTTWPLVAVHSALLKTGELLVWDGWSAPQPTSLFDVQTQGFSTFLPHASIFCSGQVQMPDGRILVAGGHGSSTTGELGLKDTTIFDPATSAWTRVADMNDPRWYPGLTELADGRNVAISGNSTNAATWAETPEVYDPEANTWTRLTGVSTAQVHEEEYPFTHLAPDGTVFTIGPSADVSYALDVNARTWTARGGTSGIKNGSSVMYRPGKVLYSGGAATLQAVGPARATTAVIDLTAPTPSWRTTAPMAAPRVYHSLTMLADGKVFGVGGQAASGSPGDITSGVLPTEIWDPGTETWTSGAPVSVARGYHSTAVLMPDARVLVAGGGHATSNTGPGQASAEVYWPPYLSAGPRPVISAMPTRASYGDHLAVTTPDAAKIRSVNLVSLAATTHQSDMSQHFAPLSFSTAGGGLDVTLPTNAALAPPATYMVFIVDDKGVPSVASMLSLAPPPTAPSAPAAPTATPGDTTASVTWAAPRDGGSPITGYTATAYEGTTVRATKTVTGTPAPLAATLTGLTNGTSYTVRVRATNAVGDGPQSPASDPVTPGTVALPRFVQQASQRALSVSTAGLTVTPAAPITAGNRLVVVTEGWSSAGATAATVTDTAGNTYTRLTSVKAPDQTELSVWTAPITAGGAARPVVTVRPTSSTSLGIAVLEYAGLSSAAGTAVLDRLRTGTGQTTAAATVGSGPTAALTTNNALVLGIYGDSGFDVSLTADANYTQRLNTSPSAISDLLVEDRLLSTGATPGATVRTGANTDWAVATIALKAAAAG